MRPLYAIALKLTSVVLFIAMASLVKVATETVPVGQAVFARSFFALPIVIGFLWMQGHLHDGLQTSRPFGHLWRGVVGTTAMLTGFASLALLPLPEASAIGYAAPILTVIFAALFLGERLRAFRLTVVGIGLVGVLIVSVPNFTVQAASASLALGATFGLISATLRAGAIVTARALVRTETTASIVFYFSTISALLGFSTLFVGFFIPDWAWIVPSWQAGGALALAGLTGGVAQLLVTTSYRHAEMAVLAPFDYTSMIFAVIIGYFFFDEVPTLYTWIGTPIVILAGLLIIYRERQLGLARQKTKEPSVNDP